MNTAIRPDSFVNSLPSPQSINLTVFADWNWVPLLDQKISGDRS